MPIKLPRVGIVALVLCIASLARAGETIHVGAAISLRESLQTIASAYEKQTGDKVELTFASSGQILAQIQNGAPLDVFISAANEQVDALEKEGAVLDGTRTIVVRNSLVLIAPTGPMAAKIVSFESLGEPTMRRLAIGEPKTVPAGKYAMQVLEHFKLTEKLKDDRIVFGANVRHVLSYIERGEVSAGMVYSSDARESGDKIRVVATAPADSHQPIVYPAVVLKRSNHAVEAKRFIVHLTSNVARAEFLARGFTMPRDQPATRDGGNAGNASPAERDR